MPLSIKIKKPILLLTDGTFKSRKAVLFAVLFKVGLQGFTPDGVALDVAGMEQVRHHALLKDPFGSEEVFPDVHPDDILVVAELDNLSVDLFIFNAAGIFVVGAPGKMA